jgi:hypothetical protein
MPNSHAWRRVAVIIPLAVTAFLITPAFRATAASPSADLATRITAPGTKVVGGFIGHTAEGYPAPATPTVSAVAPNAGHKKGGNLVTITGSDFAAGATVSFGAVASPTVSVVGATQLTAIAPPATARGVVDVTVTSDGATSATSKRDLYAYGWPTITSFTPAAGITGRTVAIAGSDFVSGAQVTFGSLSSPSVTVPSATTIRAVVPDGAVPGTISVTTAAGTATSTQTFTPNLSITAFGPPGGPAGTVVAISGVGFNSSSTVAFDGTAATSVTDVSATQLLAIVPATASSGPVTVTNTTAPRGTVQSAAGYTVSNAADLATTVSPTSGAVSDGKSVTFTVQVTNNGPDEADDVVLNESYVHGIPLGIEASAPSGVSCSPSTCTTPSLEPGQKMTVHVKLMAFVFDGEFQYLIDEATAGSSTYDPYPGNNTAEGALRILG